MMNRDPGTGANQGAHNHGEMENNDAAMDDPEMEQTEDHSDHQMKEDLEVLVPEYLKLREALANDDFDSAQKQITVFNEEDFSDIEELRAEFIVISETLIDRIESEGYEGKLFKQYCPMYDGGTNWISDSQEIENPFYGNEMHNCGETVEELNSEQGTSN
jgi:Cu(I)/Ag(I) efflux system membrane fusion protein